MRQSHSPARPRSNPRAAKRPNRAKQRSLRMEQLEARELLAQLTSGSGEGELQVWVNEYGAFGRSGTLEVTTIQNPNGPREINDAFYDPLDVAGNVIGRAGTVFESALAISVNNGAVSFLTDGTIAGTGVNNASGNYNNGLFTGIDPGLRALDSVFFYPNTVGPNGAGAELRINLRQEILEQFGPGTAPVGVTLRQTYTVTNLSGSPVDVQIFRYLDGDMLFDTDFLNDGAGLRQVIQNNPEFVWMTNQSTTNSNRNDPTYLEVRGDPEGVVRPNRWEVGLSRRAVTTTPAAICAMPNPCKHEPHLPPNAPLVAKILAGGPLADDIVRPIQADIDGNNKTDNGAGDDWSVALRNVYTIQGGGNTVYVTETEWGDPEQGDPEPPVIPPIQQGVVSGVKFSDIDSDGVRDASELGVGGFRIFADLNNNGAFNSGEPTAITDANGLYSLTLPVSVTPYIIREVQQANWTQTLPASGFYSITIVSQGDLFANTNFGNHAAPGSVSGTVFEDVNRNGRFDGGEPGLGGATIYVDINNNSIIDGGETTVVSAADGSFTLANLDPRTYIVRQVAPPGYDQSFPGNNGPQVVTVQPGQALTGIVFGDVVRPGQVNGKVYLDTNNNGVIDPTEPGAAGVIVYLDRDNNCNISLGENAIVTDARGTFGILGVQPGTYTVRVALPPGMENVLPGGVCGGYTVVVGPGGAPPPVDFLVVQNSSGPDFGDAPAPYPTTLAQDGARAVVTNYLYLGALVDGEPNGIASPDALGDNLSVSNDEDGIAFVDPLVPGDSSVNVRVVTHTGSASAARLQGWIDWNRNGAWEESERVFTNVLLNQGTFILPIAVPASAVAGATFARFRYGYEMNLGVTGNSIAGEVEDYLVTVVGNIPDARDDTYSFSGPSNQRPLTVLDNDVASASGPLTIVPGSLTPLPGFTGTVIIDPANPRQVLYTSTGATPQEQFTYTVRDPAGNTDTATVTISNVLAPLAVDDAFLNVPFNSVNFVLPVLANDQAGVGTLTVLSPTTPPSGGGTTSVQADGTILYTPATGFAGSETFVYTVRNSAGLTDTANVTIQVTPGNTLDDEVELGLTLLFLDNTAMVTTADRTIGLGQQFKVRVTTDDLRLISPRPTEARGVFSAYIDLLFDPTRLEVVADPTVVDYNPALGFNVHFGNAYPIAQLGSDDTAGFIDDVGAQQNGSATPLGPDPITLFTVVLRSKLNAPANVSLNDGYIATDPGDNPPFTDVLLYDPPTAVPISRITLNQRQVIIDPTKPVDNTGAAPSPEASDIGVGTGTGGDPGPGPSTGSGTYRNSVNAYDVSGDGNISALDALLVINMLNAVGPRSLLSDPVPSSVPANQRVYLDVDGDDFLAPLDALLIITRLNAGTQGEGEASVEPVTVEAAPAIASAPKATSAFVPASTETPSTTLDASNSGASSPIVLASSPSLPADILFGSHSSVDFGASLGGSEDGEAEDFEALLANLAENTCSFWRD